MSVSILVDCAQALGLVSGEGTREGRVCVWGGGRVVLFDKETCFRFVVIPEEIPIRSKATE